jgi:ribonuclease HI
MLPKIWETARLATDRSCEEKDAIIGIGIFYNQNDERNRYLSIRVLNRKITPSNSTAELLAMNQTASPEDGLQIELDSRYAIDSVIELLPQIENNGYWGIAHGELIQILMSRLRKRHQLNRRWTKRQKKHLGSDQ